MTAAEAQARAAVVEAGKRLLSRGLVERTWGNISARVSLTPHPRFNVNMDIGVIMMMARLITKEANT